MEEEPEAEPEDLPEEDPDDRWACCDGCDEWFVLPEGEADPEDDEQWSCTTIGKTCVGKKAPAENEEADKEQEEQEEDEDDDWELMGPGGCTRILNAAGNDWTHGDGRESYRKSLTTGKLVYYGGAVVTARISTAPPAPRNH